MCQWNSDVIIETASFYYLSQLRMSTTIICTCFLCLSQADNLYYQDKLVCSFPLQNFMDFFFYLRLVCHERWMYLRFLISSSFIHFQMKNKRKKNILTVRAMDGECHLSLDFPTNTSLFIFLHRNGNHSPVLAFTIISEKSKSAFPNNTTTISQIVRARILPIHDGIFVTTRSVYENIK